MTNDTIVMSVVAVSHFHVIVVVGDGCGSGGGGRISSSKRCSFLLLLTSYAHRK